MSTQTKVTPKVTVKANSKSNFVTKALAHLNKSDAQKQEEEVTKFVNRSRIATETQIGQIKVSKIPTLELELSELNHSLDEAKEAVELTRFTPTSTYESYVQKRVDANNIVISWENKIARKEAEITDAQKQLEFYEEVLADLS